MRRPCSTSTRMSVGEVPPRFEYSQGREFEINAFVHNTPTPPVGTPGKFRMRTPRRKPSPRVSGLLDPAQQTPAEDVCQRVGNPLQPRTASLLIRSWNSGTQPGECSGQRLQAQAASRLPRREDACAWRLASRVQPGEGSRLSNTLTFADHRPRHVHPLV